jgi:hypothetical protein
MHINNDDLVRTQGVRDHDLFSSSSREEKNFILDDD